ncbi:MAG: tripartite tricarboxylate transporter substrate binding protein [Caldilineaceae bacterium]|nr:tripartite tricarboxylate transporter substrate binding protein [Caldilineaceae bacterium]
MRRFRNMPLMAALSALLVIALLAGCAAVPAAAPAPAEEAAATEAAAEAPAEGGEAAAAEGMPMAATAGGFPNKALQIMAPANPGGGWDTTARLLAQTLSEAGISPVPVEVFNVPGAGGTIGLAQLVSQNAGDPYTIMMMGRVMVGSILTNQAPVTLAESTPLARLTAEYETVVVPKDSPYQTMGDLIAAFQADPKSIAWAGGSAGGTDHILVGQIAKAVGVAPDGINYVAYSGGGEAAAAILGGQVAAGVSGVGEWADFIASGEMRPLAVSSDARLDVAPDVPTLVEGGVDVVLLNWRGVVGPPNMSDEDKTWWIDALTAANASAQWQEILATNGWDDVFLTGDEFGAYLEEEDATITAVLKEIGLVE